MKPDSSSSRSSRNAASRQSILNLALLFAILVILNYLGFKHYRHVDLSASQFYTLSPETIGELKKLETPLTIYTLYTTQDDQGAQAVQIANLLKEYQQAAGKDIDVEKIDPAFDMNRAQDLQKKLNFDGNESLLIFQYKDIPPRFVKLEDLYDTNPLTRQGTFKGEQVITSTIMSILEGKSAKVYFTVGHGEHSLQDPTSAVGYGIIAAGLKNENIDAENLSLAQKGDVPADAAAVVIAGPSVAFSPVEEVALQKYLENNGKLIVLLDPFVTLGLDDLLQKYTLKFDDDLVLWRAMTSTGSESTMPLAVIYQEGFSSHPITQKFAAANMQLLIQGTRSVTILGDAHSPAAKAQPLLQTDTGAWGWMTKNPTDGESIKNMTYNKVTDLPGPMIISAAYDGGSVADVGAKGTATGTRVILIGSSSFLDNQVAETVGKNFFTNCLNWMVKKDAVLDIGAKKPDEYGITLSPMQFRTVVWWALVFIPGAALALGVFTWISRRK